MTAAIARLNRILSDLDELANHFDDCGFGNLSDAIDAASDKVADTREALETLASFTPSRPVRQRGRHA